MEIRPLTAGDDRLAVSKIYEESWKYAYRGLIPQDYLDSIPEGRWVSGLDRPNLKTLVCVEDGKLVGVSSFCPSRLERLSGWGEVVSIYLLPSCIGRGYGKCLMEATLSELKKLGYEEVFLWVLEENHRARGFYERLGFLPTGDVMEDTIGGKPLREVRYRYRNG